jgi:3-oxoacyl-[acyl-carrier-protein] synthase-3
MAQPVSITGWGTALPDRVVSNTELEHRLGLDAGWIEPRTGITERRIAAPHESTASLACAAARDALATAGLDAADLDLIVVATTTPEQPVPHTAAFISRSLGTRCASFDVNTACTGFITGCIAAAGLLSTANARHALVIGAETFSRIVNPEDRSTAVVFADGGAAIVLSARPDGGALLAWDLGCDPTQRQLVELTIGGSRQPATPTNCGSPQHFLRMSGRAVFDYAVPTLVDSIRRTVDRAGASLLDLTAVVPHQANARILEQVADKLGIDLSRLVINVDRFGNTSAASIPLALAEAATARRWSRGDLILMTAVGAGMTWGSLLLRW